MNHHGKHVPSLSRSATDSVVLPSVKRENSEIPLERIPRKHSQPSLSRRNNALDKVRLKQREVDFGAMSEAQEAKKQKQAEIEAKLKEAISALKRPNRTLAGKEIADVAEQRTLMAQARVRGKFPIHILFAHPDHRSASQSQRNRTTTHTQVDATPKHNRTSAPTLISDPPHYRQEPMTSHIPSSSAVSMIPSSSMKPPPPISAFSDTVDAEEVPQTGHRPRYTAIEATPTRGPAKFAQPALPPHGVRPFALAPQPKSAAVMSTPNKDARTWMMSDIDASPVAGNAGFVGATPQKTTRDFDEMVERTPGSLDVSRKLDLKGTGGKGKEVAVSGHRALDDGYRDGNEETNIYDALGWDY